MMSGNSVEIMENLKVCKESVKGNDFLIHNSAFLGERNAVCNLLCLFSKQSRTCSKLSTELSIAGLSTEEESIKKVNVCNMKPQVLTLLLFPSCAYYRHSSKLKASILV